MRCHRKEARPRARRLWAWLGGVGLLVGSALPAQAQYTVPGAGCLPPPNCPAPEMVAPAVPLPGAPSPAAPSPAAPSPAAPSPAAPSAGQPSVPSATTAPSAETQAAAPETAAPSAPSTAEASAALGGETFATGYIDPAIPFTHFRFRFDAAYDDNRPDRAEFFYAKCGCFRLAGLDPRAQGPPKVETSVDYQDVSAYLEVALGDRFSAFIEAPYRFLNAEQNTDTNGFSDMNAGFKFAFIASEGNYLTFQFRTYIPTGDSTRGLGTDHVSLEPALLWHQKLSCKLFLDAELRDWIPIDSTDFAGNVTRYGVGLTYSVLDTGRFRVMPVAEFVGWTVLSGKELAVANTLPPPGGITAVQNADGDTIVNAKVGVRFGFGSSEAQGYLSHSDLYVGYGRALTGDVWYKDILRVEYRLLF
jgi:hypothetical protein